MPARSHSQVDLQLNVPANVYTIQSLVLDTLTVAGSLSRTERAGERRAGDRLRGVGADESAPSLARGRERGRGGQQARPSCERRRGSLGCAAALAHRLHAQPARHRLDAFFEAVERMRARVSWEMVIVDNGSIDDTALTTREAGALARCHP